MDKLILVALVLGDKKVKYKDGDEAPVHQTLLYLGETASVDRAYIPRIYEVLETAGNSHSTITAKVIGKGTLGADQDEILLTESEELTSLRSYLRSNPVIANLANQSEQHPNWISHVTGMQDLGFGDSIVFNRLGLWYGNDHLTIPLKGTAFPQNLQRS